MERLFMFFLMGVFLFLMLRMTANVNDIKSDVAELRSEIQQEQERMPILWDKLDTLSDRMDDLEEDLPEFEPKDIPLNEEIQEYIHDSAVENGIDPDLIFSLIETETNYTWYDGVMDANGYHSVGYTMVNEINRDTLVSEGIDYTTEKGNIDACLFILVPLIEDYGVYDGLRAYQAGIGGMKNGRGHTYANKILNGAESV